MSIENNNIETYIQTPITKIEGNGAIKIEFDKKDKKIKYINLIALSKRHFTKFSKNRNCDHLSRIISRISNNSAVTHHLGIIMAIEDAWNIEIPKPAKILRELSLNANLVQILTKNLAFNVIPDYKFGLFTKNGEIHKENEEEVKKEKKKEKIKKGNNEKIEKIFSNTNFFKLEKKEPILSNDLINLMEWAQFIVQKTLGKSIGPVSAIVGGMRQEIDENLIENLLFSSQKHIETVISLINFFEETTENNLEFFQALNIGETNYIALTKQISKENQENFKTHSLLGEEITIIDKNGKIEFLKPKEFETRISQEDSVESFSREICYTSIEKEEEKPKEINKNEKKIIKTISENIIRTGALAIIYTVDKLSTKEAEKARQKFLSKIKEHAISPHNPFLNNWAKAIILLESIEKVILLLNKNLAKYKLKDLKVKDVIPKKGTGYSIIEGPNGLFFYKVITKENGLCEDIQIITADHINHVAIENSLFLFAQELNDNKSVLNNSIKKMLAIEKKKELMNEEIGLLLEMIPRAYDYSFLNVAE